MSQDNLKKKNLMLFTQEINQRKRFTTMELIGTSLRIKSKLGPKIIRLIDLCSIILGEDVISKISFRLKFQILKEQTNLTIIKIGSQCSKIKENLD